METVQRITGWMPGSAEHSIIRVEDDGIELEGVVLGGSLEEPFAIRYTVLAYPNFRCRAVVARAIGDPLLFELYADGRGGWINADGVVIRELEGLIDVDLGITPMPHVLTARRLALPIDQPAAISVAHLDLAEVTIGRAERRFTRVAGDRFTVAHTENGGYRELHNHTDNWLVGLKLGPTATVARLR